RRVGPMVELSVRDTGVGIPEEALPRLFERFHQVEGVRGRALEGTGIGLALVAELVKLLGGSIRAESTFGRGSTFVVMAPFASAPLTADMGAGRVAARLTPAGVAPYLADTARWLPHPARADIGPPDGLQGWDASSLAAPTQPDAQRVRPRVLVADDNT